MTSFGASNIIRDGFMTFKVITEHDTNNEFYREIASNVSCMQIQGQIYHRIGSLLPCLDSNHSFLQIYFMGNSDVEIERRCVVSQNPNDGNAVRRGIIERLQQFFHDENCLIKLFQTALDQMPSDSHRIVIRADKAPGGIHAGRLNAPTIDEVAVLIVDEGASSRDIVLLRRDQSVVHVSETHRCYDALQYPILFWQGEDGYHFNIKMKHRLTGLEIAKKVSAMNYYSYRLMVRLNEINHILNCRRLCNQFIVDVYAKIESERLNFIRFNQKKLKSEQYIHLRDAIQNDGNFNDIGQMTILPATYTGSPRHMHEYAQDAMTYVRHYHRPDLCITFTCNPQWNEIKQYMFHGQSASDRHDIVARVFKQKLKTLMDFIVKQQVFGKVQCWMYSVEWQKRGLPHAHILVWLVDKITPNEIDSVISAEIPNPIIDPGLFESVTKHMIHGPCGALNVNSPCMAEGKCTKRYPRALIAETISGNDGYPLYRRPLPKDDGETVMVKCKNQDIKIDNRWIVPYSPLLSKTFGAHINVEYCNSVKSIKYICKYVNKGSDLAYFGIAGDKSDEITSYQLGRYISTNEAIWRIFSFAIHERYPTVLHLAVHLQNGQRVYFTPENAAQRAEQPPKTTLTSFLDLCRNDEFAKTLLYSEVPHTHGMNLRKFFKDGNKGNQYEAIQMYFLQKHWVVYLRTVHGELCATYRQACQRLNLLEDDMHWEATLADSVISSSPHQIRTLFAIIISTCSPSNPLEIWHKFRDDMTEDILLRVRRSVSNPELEITPEMHNEALILIEDMCIMIANRILVQLGMIAPNRVVHDVINQEMHREQQYDRNQLRTFVQLKVPQLNSQQKYAYDKIMEGVNNEEGGFYFIDAPGGTGKTFLLSLILATIRSDNKIAFAVASSGIAATLLDGGRTAHSAFKLPLNITTIESPTCNISKTSAMAKVLQQSKIIVWDECTMAHKRSLEALNRTMQDLRGNERLFGGAFILLSGDFRQTLPVIPRSTAADELNASEFSKQLLEIGNGKVAVDKSTGLITLPSNFCNITQSKKELVQRVFPNILQNYRNHDWLSERAILAGKNKDVSDLNASILQEIDGQFFAYKSVDTIINEDEVVNYPTEFLNSLDLPGLPSHYLALKEGAPIIMLRNINQPRLCNGTRLSVKKLMANLIEATILSGKYRGENVLIPRIPMIPSDMPFEFKRLQFPVRLAFAITINKAQGQTLNICGLDLEQPVFSHGQLYVGCSRCELQNILWSDETKVNLFGSDSKHYVRRPPCQEYNPKYTKKTIKHGGGSIMVWGCFSWYGVGPLFWIKNIMDQEKYVDILENVMLPYADDEMPLIWKFQQDNDPKHTSKKAKAWFQARKIKVLDWPAQSPDLNSIENLWSVVKNDLASKKISNKAALWNEIREAWEKIPAETCRNLVESLPRSYEAVIKANGNPTKY
ncbi:uncharacterized protein LOC129945100 [Eupeodes corollae]|uniref:uncharacterized protein LOC129945100 n=1 Tax=Eupeodes corollae TaxID=290404 RepID=UPI00248FFD4F|nr:uncharacterized protein LOC129945100 [Eupeodes corollae]